MMRCIFNLCWDAMNVLFHHQNRIGCRIVEWRPHVGKDDSCTIKRKSILIHHLFVCPRTSASPAQVKAAPRWVITPTDFLGKPRASARCFIWTLAMPAISPVSLPLICLQFLMPCSLSGAAKTCVTVFSVQKCQAPPPQCGKILKSHAQLIGVAEKSLGAELSMTQK